MQIIHVHFPVDGKVAKRARRLNRGKSNMDPSRITHPMIFERGVQGYESDSRNSANGEVANTQQ